MEAPAALVPAAEDPGAVSRQLGGRATSGAGGFRHGEAEMGPRHCPAEAEVELQRWGREGRQPGSQRQHRARVEAAGGEVWAEREKRGVMGDSRAGRLAPRRASNARPGSPRAASNTRWGCHQNGLPPPSGRQAPSASASPHQCDRGTADTQ